MPNHYSVRLRAAAAHYDAGSTEAKRKRMTEFYQPDLGANPDDPFARDADGKLVRRSFWLDLSDRSLVLAMTNGIGASLANEHKRAHLRDLGREHLIDQVCVQEIILPDRPAEPA